MNCFVITSNVVSAGYSLVEISDIYSVAYLLETGGLPLPPTGVQEISSLADWIKV